MFEQHYWKGSGETGADCENVAAETRLNRPLNVCPSHYSIRNGVFTESGAPALGCNWKTAREGGGVGRSACFVEQLTVNLASERGGECC